jgi:HEAT repeat protein
VVRRLLGLHPGDGRTVGLTVSTSFFASAGLMIAQSAVDALFFARYGVEKLPVMYLLLGAVMFAASLGVTAVLPRFGRGRTFVLIPLALGVVAVTARIGLTSGATWIYAALWLVVAMSQFTLALAVWGLAGIVTDTRQAKRFFPLIGAGGVLGFVVGGLVTKPLASILGAENLLLVWAGILGAVVILASRLVAMEGRRPRRRGGRQGAGQQLIQGLRAVRSSALMRWMAVGALMFSLLFFSLYLPFSRAATARFPSPDRLAGFFGVFFGLSTGVALVTSLFVTNRLLRRFGVPSLLIVLPLLYVAGFGLLTIRGTFAVLAAFRFAQVVWLQGAALSASEAVINTVPVDRRDQTRAFLYGGPTQAGTMAAGVIALIGKQAASPRVLYGIGLGCALVAALAMARVRQAYSRELVLALREGRPNVFAAGPHGEEPFDLGRGDSAAVSVAIQGLSDPDRHVRRLAAHILGDLRASEARPALLGALHDDDTDVRTTALRSLGRAGEAPVLLEISERLSDPVPEVRLAAIDALDWMEVEGEAPARAVHPLLRDPNAMVRVRAAAFMLGHGAAQEASVALIEMAAVEDPDVREAALRGLAGARSQDAYGTALSGLGDPAPPVRAAAARALAAIDPDRAVEVLIGAMADDNAGVRTAVAEALGAIGPDAVPRIVSCLFEPDRHAGALAALERLPMDGSASEVRRFAAESVSRAVESHRLAGQVADDGDERLSLLRASLLARSQREAVAGLQAAALLGDRTAISVALDNISVTDPAQRANALEVIETVGDPELVRPLLALWDSSRPTGTDPGAIERLVNDPDEWIRACAELVAAAREGGTMTRTLTTLPLMERVMFLRKVPLFGDLPPPDLKPIASIAQEDAFADGEVIAEQGDPGDAMHLIVTGEVTIVLRRDEGPGRPLAVRGPGDVIGEMAVIASQPRMASLVAKGPVRVLTIGQRQFAALLRERPEISLAVMRVLCQRLADREAPEY